MNGYGLHISILVQETVGVDVEKCLLVEKVVNEHRVASGAILFGIAVIASIRNFGNAER
jgi:hypothetical protein